MVGAATSMIGCTGCSIRSPAAGVKKLSRPDETRKIPLRSASHGTALVMPSVRHRRVGVRLGVSATKATMSGGRGRWAPSVSSGCAPVPYSVLSEFGLACCSVGGGGASRKDRRGRSGARSNQVAEQRTAVRQGRRRWRSNRRAWTWRVGRGSCSRASPLRGACGGEEGRRQFAVSREQPVLTLQQRWSS